MNKKYYLPIGIATVLVAVQIVAVVFRIDSWPFSCYPMFSTAKTFEKVGAFQLKISKVDGNSSVVPLPGGKNTWFAYRTLTDENKSEQLRQQMQRDLAVYLEEHKELTLQQISEVTLLDITMEAVEGSDKPLIHEKPLYSYRL